MTLSPFNSMTGIPQELFDCTKTLSVTIPFSSQERYLVYLSRGELHSIQMEKSPAKTSFFIIHRMEDSESHAFCFISYPNYLFQSSNPNNREAPLYFASIFSLLPGLFQSTNPRLFRMAPPKIELGILRRLDVSLPCIFLKLN